MKKIIMGFGAKCALAVLAACAFFLTACYEKPAPSPVPTPVPAAYYIIGTVSDGATGSAIANVTVKINGGSVATTNGSFQAKVDGPGAYTIEAKAEGFLDVTKTVQVVAVAENQVSITSVDIALFDATSLPVNPVEPSEEVKISVNDLTSLGFEGVTAEDIKEGQFDTEVTVVMEPCVDEVEVEVEVNEGFIISGPVTKAVDDMAYVGRSISAALGKPFYGNSFKKSKVKVTLGGNGNVLVGYDVTRTYKMEAFNVEMYDGRIQNYVAIYEDACEVVAHYDEHGNHGTHGNGGAVGGGSGNEA